MISNLRQSSDEDVQVFFERVSTCVMLSFKKSIIDMKKEFAGGHVACIEKATKLMCEQIKKRLFISGLRTEIRQQVESNLSNCKDNQELLRCALTAEVSLSNPVTSSGSLSAIAEINNLRQEQISRQTLSWKRRDPCLGKAIIEKESLFFAAIS